MKYGLSEEQFEEVIKAISSYKEIEEAILFGSRAMDTFKEASDVDIAVKGHGLNTHLAMDLKIYFEEETDLPFFFDFISYPDIDNQKLKNHIDKKGVLIYRRGWRTVKLGEIVTLNYGKSLPKNKRLSGDIPVYGSAGLIGWHNKALVQSRGIIIGRKGTIGSVYKSEVPFFPIDTSFYISEDSLECSHSRARGNPAFPPDKGGLRGVQKQNIPQVTNLDFLFYVLSNLGLDHLNTDSAVPGLNRGNAYAQEILLPPLLEQEAIAEVLSSLDDKIELLHRQNKTLEEMAQTLFRHWFIDQAKPTWKKQPLSKIAKYLNGLACQKYPPKDENNKLPVLKIRELNSGITKNSDWVTSEVDNKYIVELGDIIFSWSGSLKIKIWHGQKTVLNQHLFKITSAYYPKWFCYFWTKHYMEHFINIAESKATTMEHIQRKHLSKSIALVPSNNEMLKMNKLINPQFEKITSNLKSILKLEKLRNILLPKLMNGFIKIKY